MKSLYSGPSILIPNAEHHQQQNVDLTHESYPGVAHFAREMEYDSQPEPRAIRSVEEINNALMKSSEEPAKRSLLPSEEGIVTPQNQLPNLAIGRPIASAHQKLTRSTSSNHGRRQQGSRVYLIAWLEDNRSYPYPSKEVVSELAAKEKMKFRQVIGWFNRCRKKMGDASNSSNSMPGSDVTLRWNPYIRTNTRAETLSDPGIIHGLHGEDLSSPEERETSLSLTEKLGSYISTSPIEQYAKTSPREECSTIQTPISVQNDGGPPRFTKRPTSNSNIRYSAVNEPTVSPHSIDRESETALRPNKSFSKTSSLHPPQDLSVRSGGKPTLPRRQKGKKVAPRKQFPPERQANKIFQCPICNIGYQYFSDWARHLEIHEPQQLWTCMLDGEKVVVDGKWACSFCGAEPTQDHLTEHNVSQCQKPTFGRRDQILSHMKRIHESKVQNPPDGWRTVVHEDPNQQFWCGFCEAFLRTTWDLRLKHLSTHFKIDGLDMTTWVHEGMSSRSLPDQFSPLVSPTHFVDPSRPTGSINTTSGVHPLNSTPSMYSLDPGSPLGPAPPSHHPTGLVSCIDPALLQYTPDQLRYISFQV